MAAPSPPRFDAPFRQSLTDLFRWRRDVRRFQRRPLPDSTLEHLLRIAALAPSVGNSQPWRFVIVEDPGRRRAVRGDFEACNAQALAGYDGDQAQLYAGLKLSGLDDAPVHLAVYADETTPRGAGLGQDTMPETRAYSVVGAIHTLWLAARAEGIGLGWVSILTPETVNRILDVPKDWRLIAYLCLGYPAEEHLDPELERHGWQARQDAEAAILRR